MAGSPQPDAHRTWRALVDAARPLSAAELAEPAVVFAPHPDDEVLGCGGTILRKREAGARVEVVFMTDGADSHARFLGREELVRLREDEARAAARALDLDAPPRFLRFPDGALRERRAEAVDAVAGILAEVRPTQLFVPSLDEGIPDHVTTHEVVAEALGRGGTRADLLAYAVWLWNRWPWVRPRAGLRGLLARPVRGAAERRRWRSMRLVGVAIGAQLERKRAALRCHDSQVRRPDGQRGWPVLADVSNGDWLRLFFRDHELFEVVTPG